ncbi:MAG: aminotransferase class V-fold PLP-dependent enzyme [Enterococcus sp.]|nr:aminotransferase class V-fold PLP-dependent enzyme [Enterococcus sp.]
MKKMYVYADNAATTKMDKDVIQAMLDIMENEYGNPSSLHSKGQKAAEILEEARDNIAKCLSAKPKEIIFTSGGTEANNYALLSCAQAQAKKGKKHIVSTEFEHHSVLNTLSRLKKDGFEIECLHPGSKANIDPQQVENAIREDTALVTTIYGNNEIGSILPIFEIGEICKEKGVLFHTDAVQAVSHVDINLGEDNIDLLSLSAHKFHGPKGVGALYVREGIKLDSFITGGAQESGRRAGTENLPGIVGMSVALQKYSKNIIDRQSHVQALRDKLIDGLSNIPHSALNGDPKNRLAGNVNFCFEGIEGESLILLLNEKGICATSGSACTSRDLSASHVLLSIDRAQEIAHGSLRLSLSEENTIAEVNYMLEVIPKVVEYLRSISPLWNEKVKNGEFILK